MPLRSPTLLACLLLLAAPMSAAGAQAQPAAPADTSSAVRLAFRPIPAGFYSPTKGIGVGVGATARNLGWRGSQTDASVELMTRYGRYGLRFASGDPFRAARFAGAGVTYTGAATYRFYGLGPRSRPEDDVSVRLRTVEVEARAGAYPLGTTRLLVMPVARLLSGFARDVSEAEAGAIERLDPASRANVLRAEGNASLGVTYGLEVVLDGLDQPEHPYAGSLLQLTARRYDGLDADPFRYWAGTATAYGFLPVSRGGRTVLEGRALLAVTRRLGERPVPFYALPQLDTRFLGGYPLGRLVGNDLAAVSGALRFPVLDVFGWVGAEGFVGLHAANAYDDVFTQLAPGLTFSTAPEGDGARTPLRPALALGGYLVNINARRVLLSGQVGITPEGFELAALQFVYDLRAPRPPVR